MVFGLFGCFPGEEPPTVSVHTTAGDGYLDVSWVTTGSFVGFDVRSAAAPELPATNGGFGLTASESSTRICGLTNGVDYNVTVFGFGSGPRLVAQGTSKNTPQAGAGVPNACGTADGGMNLDAGSDAGTTIDAGFDAGMTIDAGATVDAGFDAGVTIDAGFDAGSPWQTQTIDAQARDLYGVWGSSANDVYVVGDNGAAFHFDGTSWTSVNLGAGTQTLYSVWGSAADDVYVLGINFGGGTSTIYRFDGTGWSPLGSYPTLFDLHGIGRGDVYAVGPGGVIRHSIDGGAFDEVDSGTTISLLKTWGRSASEVYAIGGQGGVPGLILRSTTGGASWDIIDAGTPISHSLTAIWGDSTAIYVSDLQSHGVLESVDGLTWNPGPAAFIDSAGVYSIWGSSTGNVYFAGAATTSQGYVARSDGTTPMVLEPVPVDANLVVFQGIWGTSDANLFAVGNGGVVARKIR